MNKELLSHEGVHFIFNYNLRSPNSFFNEGIPSSFALFQHPERITSDCKLIQDNVKITITTKNLFLQATGTCSKNLRNSDKELKTQTVLGHFHLLK